MALTFNDVRDRPVPRQPYHFVTVVWGADYLDAFLNVCLATQVASGNLDSFSRETGCRYRVFTRAHEFSTVDRHPLIERVRSVMDVDFVAIDHAFSDDVMRHSDWFIRVMSAAHRESIQQSCASRAGIFFLPPDALFSENSFRNAAGALGDDQGAVLVNAPRLDQEATCDAVRAVRAADGTLAFSSRNLVRLGVERLQQSTESLFWDSSRFNLNPTAVYWRVGRSGFLVNSFHLHPLLVVPANWDAEFTDSIDGEYIDRACPPPSRVYVVRNTDEIAMFTMTQADRAIGSDRPNRATIRRVAYFHARTARPEHRLLFAQSLRHHTGGWSPGWLTAACRAKLLVAMLWLSPIARFLADWHQRGRLIPRVSRRYRQLARRRIKNSRLHLKGLRSSIRPHRRAVHKASKTLVKRLQRVSSEKIVREYGARFAKRLRRLDRRVRLSAHRGRKALYRTTWRVADAVPSNRLRKLFRAVVKRQKMFRHRLRKRLSAVRTGVAPPPPISAELQAKRSRDTTAQGALNCATPISVDVAAAETILSPEQHLPVGGEAIVAGESCGSGESG